MMFMKPGIASVKRIQNGLQSNSPSLSCTALEGGQSLPLSVMLITLANHKIRSEPRIRAVRQVDAVSQLPVESQTCQTARVSFR